MNSREDILKEILKTIDELMTITKPQFIGFKSVDVAQSAPDELSTANRGLTP